MRNMLGLIILLFFIVGIVVYFGNTKAQVIEEEIDSLIYNLSSSSTTFIINSSNNNTNIAYLNNTQIFVANQTLANNQKWCFRSCINWINSESTDELDFNGNLGIDFKIAGTKIVTFVNNVFRPADDKDGVVELGLTTHRWKNIYASGYINSTTDVCLTNGKCLNKTIQITEPANDNALAYWDLDTKTWNSVGSPTDSNRLIYCDSGGIQWAGFSSLCLG